MHAGHAILARRGMLQPETGQRKRDLWKKRKNMSSQFTIYYYSSVHDDTKQEDHGLGPRARPCGIINH